MTYKHHLAQLYDHFRAEQNLKYVVKGIVQRLLNTNRHVALTMSPVFHHPLGKEMSVNT